MGTYKWDEFYMLKWLRSIDIPYYLNDMVHQCIIKEIIAHQCTEINEDKGLKDVSKV